MKSGKEILEEAEWLLGFDFDGTLADISAGYTVSAAFFNTLRRFQTEKQAAWGICTGRSLAFLLEGMSDFPFLPDYVVSQERDVFYLSAEGEYFPDRERNAAADTALRDVLEENRSVIDSVQRYIEEETSGQWVSIPGDPAGIIASREEEIQQAVDLFYASKEKSPCLDYQRNTIYLRFTHKGYCKGTAVNHLQERFQIEKSKTLVMGDNYNDLTMLNAGVAQYYGGPANSITALKEALAETGGFITTASCSLGVKEALDGLMAE